MSDERNIEVALHTALTGHREYGVERPSFWASSLGMCVRKQVAERAGLLPTNPPDERAVRKMWVGATLHRAIQRALVREGFLDAEWTQVLPDGTVEERSVSYRSVSGRPDGRTKRLEGFPIVELKTADDDAITRYPDMPTHYIFQGMVYCLATGAERLLVAQIGVRQGLMKHRDYFLNDQWKQVIDEHIDQVDKAWETYKTNGVLPDHTHQYAWENKLCAYLQPKEVADAPLFEVPHR